MSNMAWPHKIFFLREVSKLFKFSVLVKNFDRKPAISLKTLKIRIFKHAILTTSMFWRVACAPKSFLCIYLDYPKTAVLSCAFAIKYRVFFRNSSL